METITLGAQTSGDDNRTQIHVLRMRKILAEYCVGPYSSEVKEFALILRIGGAMNDFDFEGCDRIRRGKKDGYISVDVGFPANHWRSRSDAYIREYLAEAVETGLLCALRRLEKDRVRVDAQRLLDHFQVAKSHFLNI
jgi:hypothetical protein